MNGNTRRLLTYRLYWQILGASILAGVLLTSAFHRPLPLIGVVDDAIIKALSSLAAVFMMAGPVLVPRWFSDELMFPHRDERDSKLQHENRIALLNQVERIWINGYLKNILNEMLALRLNVRFAEPEKILLRPGMANYKLPSSGGIKDIFQIYHDLGQRLVILGEPGSGKTVSLVQLMEIMIAEARADEKRPIPIMLALSSWAARRPAFEKWLVQEIELKYGLSHKFAQAFVASEQLLYLFDGLDEVAADAREACLEEIKHFVEDENRSIEYVISCRNKEYHMLKARLNVKGEIVLQPLRFEQINDYLAGVEFVGLRAILLENKVLRDFSHIPFMLNTMAVVSSGETKETILRGSEGVTDEDGLRDFFLKRYFNSRLHQTRSSRYSDYRLLRKRLQWLAEQLYFHSATDFYIEDLNDPWLYSMLNWTGGDVSFRVVNGVRYWLDFLFGRDSATKTTDYLRLYWNRRRTEIGLRAGLEGQRLFLHLGTREFGLESQYSSINRLIPNAGIRSSLRNSVLIGVLSYPILLLVRVPFAVIVAILLGLRFGGSVVCRHMVFRIVLWRQGYVPLWRYDRFLDYCADLVILRKVGGGYRFVHSYMHQYFARAPFVRDTVDSSVLNPPSDGTK